MVKQEFSHLVSRFLVKGIAREGNRTAVFSSEREVLRTKVMGLLKNALQPAITNINVSWYGKDSEPDEIEKSEKSLGQVKNQTKKDDRNVERIGNVVEFQLNGQVPTQIPPVFDGSRLLVYHIYKEEEPIPHKISINTASPAGPLLIDIAVEESNILKSGDFVRRLAGRKKIMELEESMINSFGDDTDMNDDIDSKKKAIIKLGVENSLSSKYTSFVGVDVKMNKYIDNQIVMTREIRNQIPFGFGYGHMATCDSGHVKGIYRKKSLFSMFAFSNSKSTNENPVTPLYYYNF